MHSEGRVYFGGGSTERYDYALTDHLGNTRLLYSDLNNNGIPDVPSEIIQEEHYLPFGMKMTGPWMGASNTDHTAYQYNGIEHVADFDLDVNMALYRTLDPLTGRWRQVDPKADLMMGWSPYNSMENSPMNFADPNGAEPITLGVLVVGALIGAGVSGATTIATNAITGNDLFQGFGRSLAFGAVGGFIGAGIGGAFAGTAFGQSTSFGVLNNFASTAATSATFGQDITLGTLVGSVAGGFVRGALPGFTGVEGGAIANIGAEALHMAGTGAITGAVNGGVAAAVDGRNVVQGIVFGAKDGFIGGVAQAAANNFLFGNTYIPGGHFEVTNQVFRRGNPIFSLFTNGGGLAAGRNLSTGNDPDDPDFLPWVQHHENSHYLQMRESGFGAFYAKTTGQYFGGNPYGTVGTFEWKANVHAYMVKGYYCNEYGRKSYAHPIKFTP